MLAALLRSLPPNMACEGYLKITNGMFVLVALIILAVGLATTFSEQYYFHQYAWASPLMIGIGCFTLAVSCLGCVGVRTHSTCSLFMFFVTQLVLLCLLVWIASRCNALGDRATLKGIIDETCSQSSRPSWCPDDANVEKALDTMQGHLGLISVGGCVTSAIIFLNLSAAFLAASRQGGSASSREARLFVDGAGQV